MLGEDAVAIVDKVSIRIPAADGFAQLLQRPGCGWMLGDVEVHQPTRAVLDQHQDIEQAKRCRHGDEKVAGDDRLGVIPHKLDQR